MRFPMSLLFCAMSVASFILPKDASAAPAISQAEHNRKLVVDFYEQFFNQHDLGAAERYIGDTYIQHNPNVPDGRKAFTEAFARVFAQFPERHSRIVRVVADGDLVVLHVHGTKSAEDRGTAIVDIFRVRNGRIVEHWDVQQSVPEKAANGNTMF